MDRVVGAVVFRALGGSSGYRSLDLVKVRFGQDWLSGRGNIRGGCGRKRNREVQRVFWFGRHGRT